MEPVHNQSFIAHNPNIPKASYIKWRDAARRRVMRAETRDRLRDIWIGGGAFDSGAFQRKVDISGICQPRIYFRKISGGEWAAIQHVAEPFSAVFDHINTDLYRYWMSSSLAKVRAFGNEGAADAAGIIIRLDFDVDLRALPALRAHQQPGVQANADAVALHREGFAEIGNIDSQVKLNEVVQRDLDHNLGFTTRQRDYLTAHLTGFARV